MSCKESADLPLIGRNMGLGEGTVLLAAAAAARLERDEADFEQTSGFTSWCAATLLMFSPHLYTKPSSYSADGSHDIPCLATTLTLFHTLASWGKSLDITRLR